MTCLIDFEALKEPFLEKQIHWRVGSTNAKKLGVKPWEATKGIPLAYIDARDVMKRLDDVLGVENWQDSYSYEGGRTTCVLSINVNGQWVFKSDGAGDTDIEGEKGGISDAFKRAAVKWGVGRYLYYLPNTWVDLENGKIKVTPKLPDWAKPGMNNGMARYGAALDEHIESIVAIKKLLSTNDVALAREAFGEIGEQGQIALWKAPSKGGVFTTKEREQLKMGDTA